MKKRTRAKVLAAFLPSILVSTLTSCFTINRKTCYFITGLFVTEEDEPRYTFQVDEISREDYRKAEGKNVVCDLVRKGYYYSLELISYSDEHATRIDLFDLADSEPKLAVEPIAYLDTSGYLVSSRYPSNDFMNCIIIDPDYGYHHFIRNDYEKKE